MRKRTILTRYKKYLRNRRKNWNRIKSAHFRPVSRAYLYGEATVLYWVDDCFLPEVF
jgi:hypothetical protein